MPAFLVAFFVALLAFGTTTSSAQEIELPIEGGAGGVPFRVTCPPGDYLMGFEGRVGGWVDSMYIHCLKGPHWRDGYNQGQLMGNGLGGRPIYGGCPYSYAIRNIIFNAVEYENTHVLNHIRGECKNIWGVQTRDFEFGPRDGPHNHANQTCPPGTLAVGLRGRQGLYIDAIGLICRAAPPP